MKAVLAAVAAIAALSAPAAVALPEALSGASSRWSLADNGRRIVWDVAHDARLPHADSFEMSGLRASLIFSYSVAADRSLSLGRRVVWPSLRVQPNNTHGSFIYDFAEDKMPRLTADGKPCGEVFRLTACGAPSRIRRTARCALSGACSRP